MLKLFNTLTGRQEVFEPIEPNKVRLYVCGVTVYDYCHIGHARSALVFDVLRRYLECSGYAVTFVKNFTDVDDKIIKRAHERGVSYDVITSQFIEAYYQDMDKLGVKRATVEPKATEHITDIIELTRNLIVKGLAYQIDGSVYFEVGKYPDYGRLSKRKLDDLQAGARVEIDERKRHPMDFALWKSSKPGEPSWPSPWGRGRPGWHIECSAMSIRYLGETFDIHGGGADLIFPHHENEIAQSCGATGKEFARYWMHNGFVRINQEKMSKSLGNFFTIREVFEKSNWSEDVTAEILRYFLLSTHYHGPLDFSDHALKEAKTALNGFYDLFGRLAEPVGDAKENPELDHAIDRCKAVFKSAMDDDFNTPEVIAAFQVLKSDVNKILGQGLSTATCNRARETFRTFGEILGLFQLDKWQFNLAVPFAGMNVDSGKPNSSQTRHLSYDNQSGSIPTLSDSEVETRIAERIDAKKRKDFKQADIIREELKSLGITIEDKPDGATRWKR